MIMSRNCAGDGPHAPERREIQRSFDKLRMTRREGAVKMRRG